MGLSLLSSLLLVITLLSDVVMGSLTVAVVPLNPPTGPVIGNSNYTLRVRYTITFPVASVSGALFHPLLSVIDGTFNVPLVVEVVSCPTLAVNCSQLGVLYDGVTGVAQDSFEVDFTFQVKCPFYGSTYGFDFEGLRYGKFSLAVAPYVEYWDSIQASASSDFVVKFEADECPVVAEEELYAAEVYFYFDQSFAQGRKRNTGQQSLLDASSNAGPFASDTVVMLPSDSMFTSFDGGKGTTAQQDHSITSPMNLSLAFPRNDLNSVGYVASDNSVNMKLEWKSDQVSGSFKFTDMFGTLHDGKIQLRLQRQGSNQYVAVSGSFWADAFGDFDLASPTTMSMFVVDNIVSASGAPFSLSGVGFKSKRGGFEEANIGQENGKTRVWIGVTPETERKMQSAKVTPLWDPEVLDRVTRFVDMFYEDGYLVKLVSYVGPDEAVVNDLSQRTADNGEINLDAWAGKIQIFEPGLLLQNDVLDPKVVPKGVVRIPKGNETEAPPELVVAQSGISSTTGDLTLHIEWDRVISRNISKLHLLDLLNGVPCAPKSFVENVTDQGREFVDVSFAWPGVLLSCPHSFVSQETPDHIQKRFNLFLEFKENFTNALFAETTRTIGQTFQVIVEIPRTLDIRNSPVNVNGASSLPGAHLYILSQQINSVTGPFQFELQLLAPCAATISSTVLASIAERPDLSAAIVSTEAQGPVPGNSQYCTWKVLMNVSFAPPTSCGTLSGVYVVDFFGAVNLLQVGVQTSSTCPIIINATTQQSGIVGSLMLYEDAARTIPTTVIVQGWPAYWKTRVTSTAITIVSTSVLSFQYSADGITWTPVATTNVAVNIANGEWDITHAAPSQPGTYVFQVALAISTASRRQRVAGSLEVLTFRASVIQQQTSAASPNVPVIVGASVAGAVALAALVVVAVLVAKRRRRKNLAQSNTITETEMEQFDVNEE